MVKTNIYIINDPTNVMLITEETLKLIYSTALDACQIVKLTFTLTTIPLRLSTLIFTRCEL